jgi:hypothetical protein
MISIEKWAGLATNASPYGIPPGAAVEQVNLQVIVPGQASVRPGTAAVTLSSHTGSTSPVIRMFRYAGPPDRVVYQNQNGAVFVGGVP